MSTTVLWVAAGIFMGWSSGFLLGKVFRLFENFFTDSI